MSGIIGSQVIQQDDGAWVASWAPYTLCTAFQPIFAFDEGKLSLVAFETLLRPFRDGEPSAPMTFFGSLEMADRITVENLSRTMHLLNAAAFLPETADIFVNFDPSLFIDHAVVGAAIHEMRSTLAEVKVNPSRVVCEITERKTVSPEALFSFTKSLKSNGFRVAIDDFGAEDSDMGRIRDLQPAVVKFDGGWVSRLMASPPGVALLATMVATFAKRNIHTLFEGIEQRWQIEMAESTGVEMVQGFALARPEVAPGSFSANRTQNAGQPEASSLAQALPQSGGQPSRPFGRRTR